MSQTSTMNGKPVFEVPAKSVLNLESGFRHKLLCDGPTFSAGTACAFSCTFCYVPAIMAKSPHLEEPTAKGVQHHEAVIRRTGAIEALEQQLTIRASRNTRLPRFNDPNDRRVLYMSPLVDVAANVELVAETVDACKVIFGLTNWHIRLLSKSVLLIQVAALLEPFKDRLIFGLSTGTLDDKLAGCFEQGTSRVSARLKVLHELQDQGFRTFGMICPSLPQRNYVEFAQEMHDAIRADKCEHVWAEVMNARGESFTRTVAALQEAGYDHQADLLGEVANSESAWEAHSREVFLAHAPLYRPGQFRFLQYVNKSTREWWSAHRAGGAVLL